MKSTDTDEDGPVVKKYADALQIHLDERNTLIAHSIKAVYDTLQLLTGEINDTITRGQEKLDARLGALFQEIGALEQSIDEIEEFLAKISAQITKFIESGEVPS